jgi:hypothetical protein
MENPWTMPQTSAFIGLKANVIPMETGLEQLARAEPHLIRFAAVAHISV